MRRIGGSDIPKLLGITKYGGPRDVYERIVNGVETEWSDIMARGSAVEPLLRAHAQRVLGVVLEDRDSDLCVHPDNDFAHAQVDDLGTWGPPKGTPIVVEYKSANFFAKGWGADGTDTIPEHVRAQVAWQMACANRDNALVVVGFGQDEPPPEIFTLSHVTSYPLQRDGAYESYLLRVAKEFWDEHIVPKIPPSGAPLTKHKPKEAAHGT